MPDNENTGKLVRTADVVAFAEMDGTRHVLLVTRGQSPFKGRLALPGGRVERGESSRAAAARELAEETGIVVPADALQFLGTWDTPGRDPRGNYSSDAYTVELTDMPRPKPGSDAAAATWVPLPAAHRTLLASDHNDMVSAADSGH
ncbi:NUDIX domain-containing protein (plasmid) [Amycolatopsis sp. FU40]|uniref:NUDIX domain-containing protein n=1 Tax=Amycolatopsis sp. FU40 TaxID=2914159 RepID=UPI001F25183B|nr:NUDIX domain-containing protein [Amycolatopsis sp. FU40]UKD50874.1 NUDIX domain-containing protein [Amycolatopsis sp. FU40]